MIRLCNRFTLLILILTLSFLTVNAQWPENPVENLLICGHTGEQTLSKIGCTGDGGTFISWQDHSSGNYDIYIQYLDADGIPQFEEGGMLVSNNPQDTWITDYDMIVTSDDRAIIAINDIRAGGDWDIYAYRITNEGVSEWGEGNAGLTISDNANFEPDPRIAETTDGNIVFAWMEETETGTVVNARCVDILGNDVWDPATVTMSSTYGLSIPRIIGSDNGSVIIEYLVAQGTQYWSPKHLYAQKISSDGTVLWGGDGAAISTAGGIGIQVKPDLAPAPDGGAVFYWYDTRGGNDHHAYAQLMSSDGTVFWNVNGIQLSLTASQMQMNPSFSYSPVDESYNFYYSATSLDQNQRGIGAQKIIGGERMFSDDGILVVPLGGESRFHIHGFSILPEYDPAGTMVVYFESVGGNEQQLVVKSLAIDNDGDTIWDPTPVEMCSFVSTKGKLNAHQNAAGQVVAVWNDDRIDDSGDIYMQNINFDGSLGPMEPVQVWPEIVITSPEEGTVFTEMPVTIEFEVHNFDVHQSEGDGVIGIMINGLWQYEHYTTDPIVLDSLFYDENTIILELLDYDRNSLNPPEADTVNVIYDYDYVYESHNQIPEKFSLNTAYPNPFNGSTILSFDLSQQSNVKLTLYNNIGQELRQIIYGNYAAGSYKTLLNMQSYSSGSYFVTLTADNFKQSRKILLIK